MSAVKRRAGSAVVVMAGRWWSTESSALRERGQLGESQGVRVRAPRCGGPLRGLRPNPGHGRPVGVEGGLSRGRWRRSARRSSSSSSTSRPCSARRVPTPGVGTVVHQIEQPAGCLAIAAESAGSADRVAEIRNRAAAPAADLVAKQPEPAGLAAADGAGGDDASARLISVRRRVRARSCSDRRLGRRRARRGRGRSDAGAGTRLRWPRRPGR